jgi:phospholipase D1/2
MNPNESFAPVRFNQKCKWFSTSADYFKCVFNAILNAKEEIFITDWWLSPELHLKRPVECLEDRLDKILIKKSVF